jgi:hypothetical protein
VQSLKRRDGGKNQSGVVYVYDISLVDQDNPPKLKFSVDLSEVSKDPIADDFIYEIVVAGKMFFCIKNNLSPEPMSSVGAFQ